MRIINNLTEEDMRRSMQVPPDTSRLAGAWLSLIEGCDLFATETVNPLIQLVKPNQRETAFLGLHYRIHGFCKTMTLLKAVVHQQCITSAERSVLELYVDMELLHRNVFVDGTDRILAHIKVQKVKAARRIIKFYTTNPDLDTNPSYTEPHRAFLATSKELTLAKAEILWGKDKNGKLRLPDHWSGVGLPKRAQKLDKAIEHRVAQGYDMRNFAVHTGLGGVINFEMTHLAMQCALSLRDIGECAAAALRIIGQEFELYKGLPDFFDHLAEVEKIPTFAIADKNLQSLGEPQRFFLHKDQP